MFGQRALSHTVCSSSVRIVRFSLHWNEIALRRLELSVDATLLRLEAGIAIDELNAGVLGKALRRQLLGRDEM